MMMFLKHRANYLKKYWVKRYVIARETYHMVLLQYDYDTTLALSDPAIGDEYTKQFEGELDKQKRLGADNEEWSILLVSFSLQMKTTKRLCVLKNIYKRVGDPNPISNTFCRNDCISI